MIQLKSNKIPKGLVPLEKLFDRSYAFVGTNEPCVGQQVVEVDIGSKETPRIIKIKQACTLEERKKIEALMREYGDVFAWSYDELKTYDPIERRCKTIQVVVEIYEPKGGPNYSKRVAEAI